MRARTAAIASTFTLLTTLASTVTPGCKTPSPTASSSTVEPADDGGAAPPSGDDDDRDDADGGNQTPEADAGVDAGPPPPPPPPPVVDTKLVTTSFAGRARSYYLSVPHDYDPAKAYPLVVNFHGNPGTAAAQLAGFPFEVASKGEAVLAYPDAIDQNWDLYGPTASNNDMPFIQALPAEIAQTLNIDLTRVFGFGFSGGAFFVNQYACRLGGTFRAISSHSGGAPYEVTNPQKDAQGYQVCPGGKIATLIIHGALDTNVTPDSGEWAALHRAHVNGCQSSREATTPVPCQNQVACPAQFPVKYCLIPNLGHAPWSEALRTSWEFFKNAP